MSVLEPPLGNPSQSSPADDELDGLLRSFFRDELPHPWPALQPPVPALMASAPQGTIFSPSRVALAASVALLLGSQAWLYHSHQAEETAGTSNSSAGDLTARPDLHRKKPQALAVPVTAKETPPRSLPVKPMR